MTRDRWVMWPQEPGSLTVVQARALRALNSGGMLTRDQIRRAAGLTRREVGRVIDNLSERRLIRVRGYDKRWSITILGRNTLAAKPSTYGGRLDG